MHKQNVKYIILGFIISIIFCIINILSINFNLLYEQSKNKLFTVSTQNFIHNQFVSEQSQNISESENLNHLVLDQNYQINQKQDIKYWKVVIPIINLEAEIQEGTSNEVLAKAVGHFENTSDYYGNIGLAAHNNTFFKNLKNINIGDKIIYISPKGIKEYKVSVIEKIEETDWTYLEQTEENKITLITCVKNMPQLRLCVQACEIKK